MLFYPVRKRILCGLMVDQGHDLTLLVEKVKKYSEQYYAIVRNSMMNTKTVYMCFYTKLKKYSRNNLSARICNQK